MRGLVERRDGTAAPSLGRIGRYELIMPLAAGGMGEVFAACERDERGFARVVALKRIRPQLASDAEFVRMFHNEARLAARLDHPNIVRVHDFGCSDGEHHLVMEYLHGASLLETMRSAATAGQAFPIPHALTVIQDVLAGLHHAHELREDDGRPLEIVHRDVSPGNVVITYEGEVKLLDFGVARAVQATQTAQGSRKGKFHYMSPEQCHGLPVDRRSDVFAVGVVLYELCTMKRPFRGDNEFAVMNAIVTGRFSAPSQVVDFAFPEGLERLILQALAVDPSHRFPTAQHMQDAIRQLAQSLPVELSRPALGQYVASQHGRRPWPSSPAPVELPAQPVTWPAPPLAHAPASPRRAPWLPAVLAVLAVLAAVVLGAWWLRSTPAAAPPDDGGGSKTVRSGSGPSDDPVPATRAEPAGPSSMSAPVSAPVAPAVTPAVAPEARALPPPDPVQATAEPSHSASPSKRRSQAPRRRRPADASSTPTTQTPTPSRDLRGLDGLLPSKK